jgi:hypothetical protein
MYSVHYPQYRITLRFIESFRFLSESLDNLSRYLPSHLKVNLRKFFPDDESFNLVSRKGLFPYEYLDKADRLNDVDLPPKKAFYISLTDTEITEEEHTFAKKVWEHLTANLKEYLLLYL